MKTLAILILPYSLACLPACAAETRPIFPLPQGYYTDGTSCGAAEIRRNRMWNGFGVSDVIGSTCQLKSVRQQGATYAFTAQCSEGNGSAAHGWSVASHIVVSGPDSFTFDGTGYKFCSADDSGRTGGLHPQPDRHLPLTAGSYRSGGGKCGALVYWDNPHAAELGSTFGGPDFGGDTCEVKRAIARNSTVSFASTCIPSRDGALMRISVPTTIGVSSPARFLYAGRIYDLCKKITY